MTVEQICCVFFGVVIEAMTFVFAFMIGASLRRKEPSDETKPRPRAGCPNAPR